MEVAWPGDYGEIHTKIMRRMKRALEEDTVYPYLGAGARRRLADARALARNTGMLERPVIRIGGSSFVIFPWLGTRAVRTLKRFLIHECSRELRISSVENTNSYYLTFKLSGAGERELTDCMKRLASRDIDPRELAGDNEYPVREKYDANVPQDLLLEAFCRDSLDVKELKEYISQL